MSLANNKLPLSVNGNDISPFVRLWGSSGGVVVKFLACGARGPGLDSRSRLYDFRDWLSPAFKSRYGWNIDKAAKIPQNKQPERPSMISQYSLRYIQCIHTIITCTMYFTVA